MRSVLAAASFVAIVFSGACVSVDSERDQMQASLANAGRLAHEISYWRSSLPPDVPESAIETIETFKTRANETRTQLDDLSEEATAGVDLAALDQALQAVANFDTSPFASASPTARAALLDQFDGLAQGLERSVTRTMERV